MNIDLLCKVFSENFTVDELYAPSTVCKDWRRAILSERVSRCFMEGIPSVAGECWLRTYQRPQIVIALDVSGSMDYITDRALEKSKLIFDRYHPNYQIIFGKFATRVIWQPVCSHEQIEAIQGDTGAGNNWGVLFDSIEEIQSKNPRRAKVFFVTDMDHSAYELTRLIPRIKTTVFPRPLELHFVQVGSEDNVFSMQRPLKRHRGEEGNVRVTYSPTGGLTGMELGEEIEELPPTPINSEDDLFY